MKLIKLASNENPIGTSPLALNAMRKTLKECYLYPDDTANYFRKRIADSFNLSLENVIAANGSVELLPTGTAVMKNEFDEFMSNVPETILVVLDEAYHEYITDPNYPDSFNYYKAGKNIITLRTFSKIYGLAGIRLGYGYAKPEIIANLMKLRVSFNANRISQAAGIAALDDHEHVKRGIEINDAGKEYLYNAYKKLGLIYMPTYANFIFVDFNQDSQVVFEKLQREGIIARTIKEYGFPNAMRITIGTEKQNHRLINTLKKIL